MRLNVAKTEIQCFRKINSSMFLSMILSLWVVVSVQAVDEKMTSAGGLDSPEVLLE